MHISRKTKVQLETICSINPKLGCETNVAKIKKSHKQETNSNKKKHETNQQFL